jgi:sugar phosphate isomerase/epimerase
LSYGGEWMNEMFEPLIVSSWSWHAPYYAGDWSLWDMPSTAVALHLPHLEANDFMLPPPRHSRLRQPLLRLLPGAPPELWRYSRANLRQLQQNAQTHGATFITWTLNNDFAVPAHHWLAQRLYLARGLAAAELLGVVLLRLNFGGQADTPAEADVRIRQRLTKFAQHALSRLPHLAITVENHWGVSSDPDRHIRLLDEVAAGLPSRLQPRFGACFDPANLPESEERRRWWAALAARANHYHYKVVGFDETGQEVGLPHGELLGLLRGVGYHGRVTLEFAGDGSPAEGIAKSVALWAQLAGQ